MADVRDEKAAAKAEEAYAAAVSETQPKAGAEAPVESAKDEAPDSAAPSKAAPAPNTAPEPKAESKGDAPAEAEALRSKPKATAKPKAPAKAKAAGAKPKPAKPVKTAAAKAAPVKAAKPITRRMPVTRGKPTHASSGAEPTIQELKEKIMATANSNTNSNAKTSQSPAYKKVFDDMTAKATAAANDAKKMAAAAAAEAQTKTKEALLKGGAVAAEMGEFSKGNVQAVFASSKILANGAKTMSQDYVLESKEAFDTLTTDLKAIAAVKTPAELFQLQGKIARRNFDSAVALSSKTSETLMKLANEAFLPISSRVSLAVDKFSKAA